MEILDTFIRHVADVGYERANLGDVAKELGMSKGTIVHHFGTKAQMLRELEENYMTSQLEAVRSLWERLERPEQRIAAIIAASVYLQVVSRDATFASQREVVQLADDPEMQQVRRLRRELQAMSAQEIDRGADDGVFRRVDSEIVTMQVWGSVQWMWVWFERRGDRTPDQIASTFVDMILGGLLADRAALADLASPDGEVMTVVRDVFDYVEQPTA